MALRHQRMRDSVEAVIQGDPGFRLTGSAGDALGLARCLRSTSVDVLVVEWRLLARPAARGVAHLRARAPGAKILLAGLDARPALTTTAQALGADGYLSLLVSPEALLGTVRDVAAS